MGNSESVTIDAMVKPERLATDIAQLPDTERAELEKLVVTEQKPGSFGELVKNAIGLINEHTEAAEKEGSNVVSFYRLLK